MYNEEGSISTKSGETTTYTKGQQKEIGLAGTQKKTYTLIGIGDKCYIWMENSLKTQYDAAGKTDLAASEMIKVYEGATYTILNELSNEVSSNNGLYLDNSGKLSILLENTGGSSGYYGNENDITSIHINTKAPASFKAGSFDGLNGLLAHEGQHALFRMLTCRGDASLAYRYSWINEGISVAVMDKVWGYSDSNEWLNRINDNEEIRNGTSLIYSDYRNTTVQDYSMPYLFVRYLAAQATNNGNPIDFLKRLYTMDATNKSTEQFMNEIITTIPNLNGKTFKDVLGSFYVAAFSPEKTGEYSFYGDTVVTDRVNSYPIYLGESGKAIDLESTAAIVVKTLGGSFTVPSNAGSDIKFYAVTKNNDIYKPANGSGTAEDPYIITTEDELNSIGKYDNAYFKLGNSIEITGKLFTAESFSGILDGNGYSINNLDKPLISENSGTIRNLNINANFNIDAGSNLGVIANKNIGTISDIKVSGNLNLNGIVINPNLQPTIGGIAGENQPSGIIERVSFEGNLALNMPANGGMIGGIVGLNSGTIKNSYSKGRIDISQNNSGTFIANIGGLIGRHKYMGAGTTLRNSYSIMELNYTGSNETVKTIGSLVGSILNSGPVTDSYGIDTYNPIGSDANNITGKKTLFELQNQSTFTNWDFNGTWKMDIQADRTPIFIDGYDINSISASLIKDTYFVGEKLNLYGMDKLNVNGTEIDLTEQMLNMNEFDSSTVGNNKVMNGSYMGKNFTVTYNIVAPSKVEELQIADVGNGQYYTGKLDYIEGETYSDEGVVLKAKLNNSSYYTYIYSGFTNNLPNPLTKSDTEVQISYFGQTVSQSITVREKTISSITVFNKADKSTYVPGNIVELTGIRYQINYSDGSKSKVLGYSDLSTYNLKVAQTNDSGTSAVEFDLNKILEENDNNTKLYIYYGTAMPGTQGAISAEILNLSVVKRLYMEDKTFRAVKDKEGYWESGELLNSNYDVETTKKSGELPPGVTAYAMPNNSRDYFGFDGTPTALGTYVVTYTIAKIDGSDSIDVSFTFNVEEVSNEALLEALTLTKDDNPSLPYDIEGTIDNVNNTIKFTVPYGTDVTNLKPTPTYHKNSSLPSNLWSGAVVDFSNPVDYMVTAEDGVTKKTYKVSVEVLSNEDAVTSIDIDNKISEIRVGASHTFIANMNGFGSFDRSVTWNIEGASSQNTTIDNNGKLTIGEDESSSSIRVIATASGDVSKSIEISINVIQKEQLAKVTELAWDRRLAKWAAILNAEKYELNLYKDDELVQTIIVSVNEYDLTEIIRELGGGNYSFTIVAKSREYKDSIVSDKSSVFKFKNSKPVIDGATDIEIEFGENFDPKVGISATDEEDGNYSVDDINVEGTVDTNKADVYTLTYSVTDSDNNTTIVERRITVKERPATPPQEQKLDKVENLIWNGMNATWDKVENATRYKVALYRDNNLIVEKTIDSNGAEILSLAKADNTVSYDFSEYFNEDGDYKFTVIAEADGYISSDVSGEDSNDIDNINEFINIAPEIIATDKIIKLGDSFNELTDVKAMDKEEGDITDRIEVIHNTVNVNTLGVYKVTYKVTDKQGLTTVKTISVTVRSNEKPVIIGADNIEIKVGTVFDIEAGVEAIDNEEGNITSKLSVNGVLDYNTPGEYKITYSVTDNDGNMTTVIRKITVKEEEKPNVPVEPENPGTEEKPNVPVEPENPGIEETPELPETPDISEKPSNPEDVTNGDLEEIPENSEMLEVQTKPDNSENVSDSIISENENNKNELPQTGATISNIQTSIFAMLSIAIGTLLNRRKRK